MEKKIILINTLIKISKRNFNYFNLLIYFYRRTIFSELNEIKIIILLYALSSFLFVASISYTTKLFKFLFSNDLNLLKIQLFTYSFEISILYFVFFLAVSIILSFLMFYFVNKRIICYAVSIMNKLTKKYIVNIGKIKKFFSKEMNVNENSIDFLTDINIITRLIRISLLNLFDLMIVSILTVTLFYFNFILFLLLSILFFTLLYFQIKTSKSAFKYQENFKNSFRNLKESISKNKKIGKEIDKYSLNFANRFLIVEKSRNYSNFFLVFIIIGVVIYIQKINLSGDEIASYSLFLLLGIRIYVSSCKSIFSYFTSLNLFYLNLRKIILLISYLNNDDKILNKTITLNKSIDLFDNKTQGISSIE